MKLMTKEIRNRFPEAYSTDGQLFDAVAQVRFFDPCGSWSWLATEIVEETEEDTIFFGLVLGFEQEFGNFSLRELESVKGPLGLGIEREIHFEPTPLRDCRGVEVWERESEETA